MYISRHPCRQHSSIPVPHIHPYIRTSAHHANVNRTPLNPLLCIRVHVGMRICMPLATIKEAVGTDMCMSRCVFISGLCVWCVCLCVRVCIVCGVVKREPSLSPFTRISI